MYPRNSRNSISLARYERGVIRHNARYYIHYHTAAALVTKRIGARDTSGGWTPEKVSFARALFPIRKAPIVSLTRVLYIYVYISRGSSRSGREESTPRRKRRLRRNGVFAKVVTLFAGERKVTGEWAVVA